MRKVLVVDDEKLIVKGIRFSLEQDGMEVDCAYDGEEALNMAKANEYDMILLDIMLPKMDGFEVCQAIREFSDMPIVMLTAKGDDMDKILGLDYGADDYITKPFNILEVKARIKAIMRRTAASEPKEENSAQFDISDTRTLDEVVNWLLDMGHIPSFCTACYRAGRTGDRFMSLVKSGQIANCCAPNALMTLKEYLEDYASADTRAKGEVLIQKELKHIPNPKIKEIAARNLKEIIEGKRDFRF